jgi:hypothetical protein
MKILLLAAFMLSSGHAFAADACAAQIPESLKAAVSNSYPKSRLPAVTDNRLEDLEWRRRLEDGREICLGVAKADFDGDGKADFVLGLTALDGSGGVVIVALARGPGWKIATLRTWPQDRDRLYVGTGNSGEYERSKSLIGPLEPEEREQLKCRHSAVVFGTIDSTGVAYCLNNGVWEHSWVSD